jgi:hypothetical protein
VVAPAGRPGCRPGHAFRGFVAEAGSGTESSFGTDSARDLTANRCAEIFSDLQHPRKEQWTIRNSTG